MLDKEGAEPSGNSQFEDDLVPPIWESEDAAKPVRHRPGEPLILTDRLLLRRFDEQSYIAWHALNDRGLRLGERELDFLLAFDDLRTPEDVQDHLAFRLQDMETALSACLDAGLLCPGGRRVSARMGNIRAIPRILAAMEELVRNAGWPHAGLVVYPSYRDFDAAEPADAIIDRAEEVVMLRVARMGAADEDFLMDAVEFMFENFRQYIWRENDISRHPIRPFDTGFHGLLARRPLPNADYFQENCTPKCSLDRASLVARDFSPEGTRILLLGDDDFVSVALARRGFGNIDVIDIDDEVISFIEDVSARENHDIRLQNVDLLTGLPHEMRRAYDVVLADPIYTLEGMRLFLRPAVSARRRGPSSRIYFSLSPQSCDAYDAFRQELLANGLGCMEEIEGFNEYPMVVFPVPRNLPEVLEQLDVPPEMTRYLCRIHEHSDMHVIGEDLQSGPLPLAEYVEVPPERLDY